MSKPLTASKRIGLNFVKCINSRRCCPGCGHRCSELPRMPGNASERPAATDSSTNAVQPCREPQSSFPAPANHHIQSPNPSAVETPKSTRRTNLVIDTMAEYLAMRGLGKERTVRARGNPWAVLACSATSPPVGVYELKAILAGFVTRRSRRYSAVSRKCANGGVE
jgi:hypothetical protein